MHGPIELWPRVANMCFMCGILGNSLSFVLTVLVLFVSGTSDDRGKAPA